MFRTQNNAKKVLLDRPAPEAGHGGRGTQQGRNRGARLFLASLYPQNQKVPLSCTFTKRPKSTGTQGTMKPPFSYV